MSGPRGLGRALHARVSLGLAICPSQLSLAFELASLRPWFSIPCQAAMVSWYRAAARATWP